MGLGVKDNTAATKEPLMGEPLHMVYVEQKQRWLLTSCADSGHQHAMLGFKRGVRFLSEV